MNKKLAIGFSSIVLAGTLGFGTIASAVGPSGGGNGSGSNRPHLTTEQKCDKSDEIVAKATGVQDKIAQRVAKLQERRAKAVTAGDDERVARIDKRLARLEKASARVAARLEKFQTWVGENCTA